MGSLIIVLTAFAVYYSEVYCGTLSTKVAKPEDIVLLERNNDSHATIDKGSFWKSLSQSKRKAAKVMEESKNLGNPSSEVDKRKGRFLSSLAFLTGLSFGGLANAASSTVKSIAKLPQMFSINLGSSNLGTSNTSPYFAAYYSQYPYAPILPYPFFYPGAFGLAPMIDAKPQTPQVINMFDNRPIDPVSSNEDYTDTDTDKFNKAGNGADDRIRLRAEADQNAEEKSTTRRCKEGQRKHSNVKETAKEREYIHLNAADLRAALNFQVENQTEPIGNILDNLLGNITTTTMRTRTTTLNSTTPTISPPRNTTQQHHHHHHHHHHGNNEYFPGYYGGYPQNIQHVELTTNQPYSQISYNVPYEQPGNFYQDDKFNIFPGFNPSFPAPFLSDQTNEFAGTNFNRLYPSGYQLPNISEGFKPLK